jgi:hypothetical protein
MAAQERFRPVVRDGRVVGAEQELALMRCREALGYLQIHTIRAATRLFIEMGEP